MVLVSSDQQAATGQGARTVPRDHRQALCRCAIHGSTCSLLSTNKHDLA